MLLERLTFILVAAPLSFEQDKFLTVSDFHATDFTVALAITEVLKKILSTLFAFKRTADFYWSCKRCSACFMPQMCMNLKKRTTNHPHPPKKNQLSSQDFHRCATLGANLKVKENQPKIQSKFKNRHSYSLVDSGFSWDCLDMNQRNVKRLFSRKSTTL